MKLYVVTLAEIKSRDDMRFLTVCAKKKDCVKYIKRRLVVDNKSHFVSWCNLRGLNPAEDTSWEEYIMTADVDFRKYAIRTMSYNKTNMAMLLRILNGCVPLGCGYESKSEYIALLESVPQETLEEIDKKISEELKEE